MAGVPDPLEDMLYSDVDEKAVSDLVGSLESQLGAPDGSAAPQGDGRRPGPPQAQNPNLGQSLPAPADRRRSGLQRAEPKLEVGGARENGSEGISASLNAPQGSVLVGASPAAGRLQSHGKSKPAAGLLTSANCSSDAAVVVPPPPPSASSSSSSSPPTDTLPHTNHIASTIRTVPSRVLPSESGSSGTVAVNSPAAAASAPTAGAGVQTSSATAVVGATGSSLGSENGNMSASNGTNGPLVSAQPDHVLSQPADQSGSQTAPAVALHRPPNVVPNGSDPKVAALPAQGVGVGAGTVAVSAPAVVFSNANATLVKASPQAQIRTVVPSQMAGSPVGLNPSPPAPVTAPAVSMQAGAVSVGAPLPVASTPSVLVKPEGGLVGQPAGLLRPATPAPMVATAVVPQRPGVPVAPRAVAPQLTVRPQQQTTIQLPPGFTIPQGMVLVRTEAGQLVLVPQQVLAQAKAQNQSKPALSPRPATPTTTATFRVTTPVVQSPVSTPAIRPIPPAQAKVVQAAGPASPALQKSPVVTVSSAPKPAGPTVITAGARVQTPQTHILKPSPVPASPVPAAGTTGLSPEMQENVKKCKNFLATLIKLASHNSPSPETSRNVKALVQDLLDAKIEPEEFTNRLQTELKSSPQPYLIPFLKKSLPALRMTLLNSQQSLIQLSQPTPSTPVTVSTIKAPAPVRCPVTTVPPVRPAVAQDQTAIKRAQPSPARMPVVVTQTIRPQVPVVRGPTVQVRGPVGITMQASANQKQKLNDPGGGTFKDDDDINDVASMAGVNLNEENARILATGSELVGTQIRSCKDETFLQANLLHKRILEIARKFGVNEIGGDVVSLVSHAAEVRLRSMLENVTALAQHRTDSCKDEERLEQTSDVRTQLKFFEQLERLEKQRKDDEEREILLKVAKSRSRQEDPEQARLKQKAKEMQQQELAQMRQRDANLTALAAIGPRKKRKLDGGASASGEVSGGSLSSAASSSSSSSSRQVRQRITRVNLRDLIFCLEQERSTARSLLLYKALLK
ncbi:transcription initiation factor TFIID subunit 4 [Salminus brasiliensis]|uniref:transcription initiation factor TFIID subunit 4 n=1 Tax=Salminus brasiliensis TaxID=930266 RepID=UPI003B833694